MYILYNQDGSILKKNLPEFIQRGNNDVNEIFVSVKNRENTEWSATACFSLPDDEVVTTEPTSGELEIDGVTYTGWIVSVPSTITVYQGRVYFALKLENLSDAVLCTYECPLVINYGVRN